MGVDRSFWLAYTKYRTNISFIETPLLTHVDAPLLLYAPGNLQLTSLRSSLSLPFLHLNPSAPLTTTVTMSNYFIILRLLPSTPITGAQFFDALQNLSIRVYDRSVNAASANVVTGDQDTYLGQASNFADIGLPLLPVPATATEPAHFQNAIIQHLGNAGGPTPGLPVSVATAVVMITVDPTHQEYPSPTSFDVRYSIQRGNGTGNTPVNIPVTNIDYNIVCVQMNLSLNPFDYVAAAESSYIYIPPLPQPLPPDTAGYVAPSPPGEAPDFTNLSAAITKVLTGDHPTRAPSLAAITQPLTIAQANEVASEIVYNRWINPPPVPNPTSNAPELNLENMYTYPFNMKTVTSDDKSQKWVGRRPNS